MTAPKIVVDTDILLQHLLGDRQPSVLREALGKFFCYATAFQAIELFALARTEKERSAIEDSMAAMKLLGLSPKNAGKYGRLVSSHKKHDRYALLIAGLCIESRLPLLTDRRSMFKGIKGLQCIPSKLVGRYASGAEILKAAQ